MDIKLPRNLNPFSLEKLQSDLIENQYVDNVNVDFSTLDFSYPMAMLVAGSFFRQWIKIRRNINLQTNKSGISEHKSVHSYLMHLGFFDYAGMANVGSKVGTAKGNTNYLPIREIKRSDLEESIRGTGERFIDAIIFLSDGIANVLAGNDANEAKKAFSYSIREVIRNALEHSGKDSCFICGQRWANGESEIAIIDEGIGLYGSLSQSYDITEDQALTHAIKPGISRTHKMTDEENIYRNSGFGLYILSELGSSFGWFCLGSGLKKLTCKKEERSIVDLPYQGTFAGIHLNSPPRNFAGVLEDIISAGEEEAQKEGRYSAASEISKTL